MNNTQCLELRDLISASSFPADKHGHVERRFRFVAVTSTVESGVDATVHFSCMPGAWERADGELIPEAYLRELIANSPFGASEIALNQCTSWTVPWSITALAPTREFPALILVEHEDLTVDGVLMREPFHGSHSRMADRYPEREQALALLSKLQAMPRYESFLGWYKDSNIEARTLEDACASTAESQAGQKSVVLYRGDEWFYGIWNNPLKPAGAHGTPLLLSSIADFHGTRVSSAKLAKRDGLELVLGKETLRGDVSVLDRALELAREIRREKTRFEVGTYENHPGVKALCDWWNTTAPSELRSAGCFRLYVWDEQSKVFHAGDPDEPALAAGVLAQLGPFALFEKAGAPLVAVQFLRGRQFNEDRGGDTLVFSVNGDPAYDMGLSLHQTDEAYFSVLGLESSCVQVFSAVATR